MGQKTDYARYTFAFASDVQRLADDKHVRVVSFNTKPTTSHNEKSYDLLTVRFLVARPDRDAAQSLQEVVEELEQELSADAQEVEVISDEV